MVKGRAFCTRVWLASHAVTLCVVASGLFLAAVIQSPVLAKSAKTQPWQRPANLTFFHSEDEVAFHPLIRANLPLVRAKVDGREVCALVDSGSDNNAIALLSLIHI